MEKIILIGSNHAGTAAANTILSNYSEKEVKIYDANSNISFLGCGMALWIGNQISTSDGLFYSNKEKLEGAGAKIFMETNIESVDFKGKVIHGKTKNGDVITESYDKLILATGSIPIVPKVAGTDLENVQFVKLFQDAQEVIEKIKNPEIKNVTVIGGGYIGVELAEAFKRNGKNITLLDMADTCLSNYYDEPFTDKMSEVLKSNGVNLVYGESLVEIKGQGKVQSVVTNKQEIPTDMVLLCIGFSPNNALGKNDLELFKNGAYVVNANQETSIKDVYAIGDCATIYDNSIDCTNYIALATNAVRSGIVAAHNICGTAFESIGTQGSNGICIFDYKMVSTGITVRKARDLNIPVMFVDYEDLQRPEFIESGNDSVKIRIVYHEKTREILGAQLASNYDISMVIHMFSLAIQEKTTIDKLKLLDIFFLPHFNKPYNYITMAALSAK